ncbi:MAG TPA: hypothetical protein VKR42_00010 [Ktedonobacteraceae bacterium]|nr:hypothetical protein [Ktedonobacteraceae bacterium]
MNTISLIRGWYRISAPSEVASTADFSARERVRKGHFASLLILCVLLGAIATLPQIGSFPWATPGIILSMCFSLLAIPFNRRGNVYFAAILLIIASDISLVWIVLGETGGLNPLFLPVFDVFILAELVAVSLLPPANVFLIATLHSAFFIADVNLQTHSMMWVQMVNMQGISFYSLLVRPVTLQFTVALISYLLVRNVETALQRADRAEIIAALEQRERQRQEEEIKQKQELEAGIQSILNTHVRIANGDIEARTPLPHDHILWQVGMALNNLLARFQHSAYAEQVLQQTENESAQLRLSLRRWYSGQRWYHITPTNTPIAPLVNDVMFVLGKTPPPALKPGPVTPRPPTNNLEQIENLSHYSL